MKCKLQIITQTLYQKTHVLYQIPLSTTHVVDYGVLTIYESNAPFPDTRHQIMMMFDKDILELFFEDLNYVSPDNHLPPYKHSNSQLH